MRLVCFIFFLIPIFKCFPQDADRGKYIKGNCFEGYVFPKENIQDTSWIPFTNFKERFSPTKEEILKAENILKDQIKAFNEKRLTNQGKGCPIIHKRLKRYKRQYFGYINNEGERIIWINFIWDKNKSNFEWWDRKVVTVLDGCSYYWNIKVNIKSDNLLELFVNGSS